MRVLVVIDSLTVGGAEQSLATLTPHLVKRGIDLHVGHLLDVPGVGPELGAGGATLHSLSGRGGRVGSVVRTSSLIRRLEPDLVHTTLFEGDITGRTAAFINRVPVVSSFVTESYGPEHRQNPEYREWKVRLAQLVDATTARFVTRFHAVSSSSADVMAERLGLSRRKIDVVPRCRDENTLGAASEQRRRRVRASLDIAEDEKLIVAVGRHYNLKGLDTLIRAFPVVVKELPEARLFIAGRFGPATRDLERLAAEGGVVELVTLAGYRDDVPDVICAADVFVLPSRTEGSPGALIEAMALGAPVVASDIPSVREVAGPGPQTVELVQLDTPDAMAASMVRLLSDREHAAALSKAARLRFETAYTVDSVADDTLALYERSLNASRIAVPLG